MPDDLFNFPSFSPWLADPLMRDRKPVDPMAIVQLLPASWFHACLEPAHIQLSNNSITCPFKSQVCQLITQPTWLVVTRPTLSQLFEAQNLPIDVYENHKVCRSPDFWNCEMVGRVVGHLVAMGARGFGWVPLACLHESGSCRIKVMPTITVCRPKMPYILLCVDLHVWAIAIQRES